MAENYIDLKHELESLKFKNKLWQRIDCSDQENKEYCNLKKTNYQKSSIKNRKNFS